MDAATAAAPKMIWAGVDNLTWVEADPDEVMKDQEFSFIRADIFIDLEAKNTALLGDYASLQQAIADWRNRANTERLRAEAAERRLAEALTHTRPWGRK